MIPAIIIAAGESRRMGRPKALLPFRGSSFLRAIIRAYESLSIEPIVVVAGARARLVIDEVCHDDVTVVINENYLEGQLSSILAGIDAVEHAQPDGVILHPVDHPCVSGPTIETLVSAFRTCGRQIVVPIFGGKRGHPVIFSSRLFDDLKNASPAVGAREVVWNHPDQVEEVPVADTGVTMNIDTPELYENL